MVNTLKAIEEGRSIARIEAELEFHLCSVPAYVEGEDWHNAMLSWQTAELLRREYSNRIGPGSSMWKIYYIYAKETDRLYDQFERWYPVTPFIP